MATDSPPIDVSIVIVTWNCEKLIARCLKHVYESDTKRRYEVIVVDNDSADKSCDIVEKDFPQVTLIRNPNNDGFAKGNNIGFEKATGDYILLLNPDAFLEDTSALEQLCAYMDDNPGVAASGPRLLNGDGSHQVGDAGYRVSFATALNHSLGLTHASPNLKGLYINNPKILKKNNHDVDWICGACMMVRGDVINQVGGLDETIFMYSEDVEWGVRMMRAGYRLAYLPQIKVLHLQGGTQKGEADSYHYSTKWLDGKLRMYKATKPGFIRVFLFRLAFVVGFGLRGIIYGIRGLLTRSRFHLQKAKGMFGYCRHALSA